MSEGQENSPKPSADEMTKKLCACLDKNDMDGMDALLKEKVIDLGTLTIKFTKDGQAFEKVSLMAYFAIYGNADGISRAAAAGAPLDKGQGTFDPLICAAFYDHWDAARALVDLGRDPHEEIKSYGSKNVFAFLAEKGKHKQVRKLKDVFFEYKDAPLTEETDLLVVSRDFGGKCLQDVFNFEAGHKTTLIRTAHDGPVEAMTQTDFAQISNKGFLHDMHRLYADRGGTASDSAITGRYPVKKPDDCQLNAKIV